MKCRHDSSLSHCGDVQFKRLSSRTFVVFCVLFCLLALRSILLSRLFFLLRFLLTHDYYNISIVREAVVLATWMLRERCLGRWLARGRGQHECPKSSNTPRQEPIRLGVTFEVALESILEFTLEVTLGLTLGTPRPFMLQYAQPVD